MKERSMIQSHYPNLNFKFVESGIDEKLRYGMKKIE